MRSLRQSAETQIEAVVTTASIEADRLRAEARQEGETIVESARREAEAVRTDAAAIRSAAETRRAEVERLEAELNAAIEAVAKRLGIERPSGGWLSRLRRK